MAAGRAAAEGRGPRREVDALAEVRGLAGRAARAARQRLLEAALGEVPAVLRPHAVE